MTTTQQIITIASMSVAVILTRCLPFILFPSKERTPRFVRYLGRYLASAVFGMLVIYCLKDVDFLRPFDAEGRPTHHGMLEIAGISATILLHLWRRNMLFSIAGGTVFYMLLKQYM